MSGTWSQILLHYLVCSFGNNNTALESSNLCNYTTIYKSLQMESILCLISKNCPLLLYLSLLNDLIAWFYSVLVQSTKIWNSKVSKIVSQKKRTCCVQYTVLWCKMQEYEWNVMCKNAETSCSKYRRYAQNTEMVNILCSKVEMFTRVAIQNFSTTQEARITAGQQTISHQLCLMSDHFIEI